MNKYIGSSIDSLFEEQGTLEEVERRALKKGVSETVLSTIRKKGLSKADLAARLGTSRSQLDRWLNPDDTSITLATLVHLARILDLEASFSLQERVCATAAAREMRSEFLTKPISLQAYGERRRANVYCTPPELNEADLLEVHVA